MSVVQRWSLFEGLDTQWRRCDLCRWTGPSRRFATLYKDGNESHICKHDWCWGNEFTRQQLYADGWGEVPYRAEE